MRILLPRTWLQHVLYYSCTYRVMFWLMLLRSCINETLKWQHRKGHHPSKRVHLSSLRVFPLIFYEYRCISAWFLAANSALRCICHRFRLLSLCTLCWSSCTWRWVNSHWLCWWFAFVTDPEVVPRVVWPTLLIQLHVLIYRYLHFTSTEVLW